jgi:hypothetical protein
LRGCCRSFGPHEHLSKIDRAFAGESADALGYKGNRGSVADGEVEKELGEGVDA